MKNTLIFLILLLSIQAKAQIFKIKSEYKEHIDSKKNTWSIGLNGNSARVTSGFINPPLTYYFPTIGLKVGYNPSNRTTLGVEYSHQPVWGNVLIRSEQLFYTGIFARYDVWRRRHALSLELNYRVSNVSWYGFGFEKTFPVHYGGIGYNFRTKLYPNVYFTYSKIWQFNLTQPKASFIQDARMGISYCFNAKTKDTPLKVANPELDRTGKLLFGITGAYISFDDSEFIGGYNWYETTARLGFYQSSFLSIGWYGRFASGVSQIPNRPKDFFYFTGPFVNAKLLALKKINFFIEMAYVKSNFTLLSGGGTNELPKDGNATYISTTTGVAYRITKNLSLEAAFNTTDKIITDTGGSYGAGGYRIGIEKTFTLKRKETVSGF